MYKKCDNYDQEMAPGNGCNHSYIKFKNVLYPVERIAANFAKEPNRGEFCHDCGVEEGQIHHSGCDCERCPLCGGQVITCNCGKDGMHPMMSRLYNYE